MTDTGNVRNFPGVTKPDLASDLQPDAAVIEFCADMLESAKAGTIRAIAVAVVQPGRVTADGWRRADHGADCCHELMAAITYLQLRYGCQINANFDRDGTPPGGGAE